MIDDQVHFREPGLTYKADIATRIARLPSPAASPASWRCRTPRRRRLDRAALEDKYARAAEVARVNYAFYLGATNDNLDEIRALDPLAAPGIKVFMGASTGNMLVDDPADARCDLPRSAGADHHALRGHADDPRQRSEGTREAGATTSRRSSIRRSARARPA